MRPHQLAAGALAFLAALIAHSATVPALSPAAGGSSAPGRAHLRAFGSRGPQQGQSIASAKLDSALVDLLRHQTLVRASHQISDLRSLHPAAHFIVRSPTITPLVAIDAVTRGDPQKLKNALIALGLQHSSVFSNDVGGWLPINQLGAAAARAEVHSIRASASHARAGAVTSQGDFAQRSAVIRTTYPTLTGSGVTVGILSDSFDCYSQYATNGVPASGSAGYAQNGFLNTAADDVASGDLPAAGVNVLQPESYCMSYGAPYLLPYSDEGRAMAQIVHDVAPGAAITFYTADDGSMTSEADFANGILALTSAGAKVIADDVGYYDEPFYQDGIVAQAVDQAAANGVAYFSAAGNNGDLAYENTSPSFATLSTSSPNAGEYLLNFDISGATTSNSLPVTIPALYPGEFLAVVLQWNQPYVTGAPNSPGAGSHMDLCVTGASGNDIITDYDGNPVACTGPNATGSDPVQIMFISNPANASGSTAVAHLNIMIGVADGTTPPTRIIVAVEDNGAGASIDAFATHSYTLQGHPGAAGAAAVGAANYLQTPLCGTSPAAIEGYSSAGGAPILFDITGTALAAPVVRQKPDFVGPDGVNTTFFGQVLPAGSVSTPVAQCQDSKTANGTYFPTFFGTSAATPHVAGIAALMLQANPSVTPAQIIGALQKSASAMGGSAPNFSSGYGFVQADSALTLVAPGVPTLSLGPETVLPGAMTTLTWSSINATGCTASGSWSGALKASGALAVTAPSNSGTATYTLTCSNAAGTSAPTSVKLTVAGSSGPTLGGTGGGSTVTPPPANGSGAGAMGELTLLTLAALAFARALQKGRALRRSNNNGTSNLVMPCLPVLVDGDPDETKADDSQ